MPQFAGNDRQRRLCWQCERVFPRTSFSASQIRQYKTQARCTACVSAGSTAHAHLPAALHELELPAGISVDLLPIGGDEARAEQFDHADFGRSVRFGVGTHYEIEVTNESAKPVFVKISIDGEKVQTPPMQVRRESKRIIRGFTESRIGREVTDTEGRRQYETETTTSPFVATLPDATAGANRFIGQITFKFYPSKWVNTHPGSSHTREWLRPAGGSPTGGARDGVLQTRRGPVRNVQCGRNGPTKSGKPVSDAKKVLGGCTITICDRDRS